MKPVFCGALIPTHGGKIVGFHIKGRNIPGLLGEIATLLAKYGLNIVHLANSSLREEEVCDLFIAVDFSDVKKNPSSIAREIRRLEKVLEVEVRKPAYGFLLDEGFFPLEVGGAKVTCLGHESLKALVSDLREKFGSGVSTILYVLGRKMGRLIFDSQILPSMSRRRRLNIRKSLEILRILCQGYGWCRVEILSVSDDRAKIKILNSFEGEVLREEEALSSELKGCYCMKGILDGVLENVVGSNVRVRELSCVSRGGDGCVFSISVKKPLKP